MSELDLVWLACFIDCEGCIGIYPHKGKYLECILTAGNTDPVLANRSLEILRQLAGEDAKSVRLLIKPTGKKPFYEVRVTKQRCLRRILAAIIPHLCGDKKAKAELMLSTLEQHQPQTPWSKVEVN